jgi:nucleoside phosphorylase
MSGASNMRKTVDFAVVTIIPEAYNAAREMMGLNHREDPGDAMVYYSGYVSARDGSGDHFVVCGSPLERSNIPAATFTYKMLETWRPRCLLVADIGGGVAGRDNLLLGDVVASEKLHFYEFEKRVKPEYKPRNIAMPPSAQRLRALARDVQQDKNFEWYHEIKSKRPEDAQGAEKPGAEKKAVARNTPELTLGEIIVGDKLLGDPEDELLKELLEEYDKAKAIDMESAGVAHAIWAFNDARGTQFLVLRGISDFVNRAGNQEMRDLWKAYATEAAIAAAKAIIESYHFSAPEPAHQPLAAPAANVLGDYPKRLAAAIAEDPTKPPFLMTVNVDDKTSPSLEMSEIVRRPDRRWILLAPAGAGKTELLKRTARDVGLDPLPVLIDLKRWTLGETDALLKLDPRTNNKAAIDVLLSVASGDIGIGTLQSAVERQQVLLTVDGLNEVDPDVANRIVDTVNHYVRLNGNASALLTDRAHSARYTDAWKPVLLNPLGDAVVSSQLDSHFGSGTYAARSEEERALLAVPFFLTLALEGTTPELGSRADALRQFFINQVRLSQYQLDDAAMAALDVYRHNRSRSFTAEIMKKRLGDEVWTRLTDANVISRSGEERRFEHQLFHDFLASVALLAADRREWTHELLDAVTFHTSSIDPLTFALAQTKGAEQGDALLRALEDWNWGVTVRVMTAVERERQLDVSPALRIALLANLAEKRFDPIAADAREAQDLFEKFQDPEAVAMRNAKNPIELAQTVAAMPVHDLQDWYEDWRTLFTRQEQFIKGTISELVHRDVLHGWTAANVVRRFPLTEDQEKELRDLYESRPDEDPRSASIRWRTIHAMGCAKSPDVVGLLLNAAASDPYSWARYGAIRGLIEIAAREVTLRDSVLGGLRQLLPTFDARERIQLVRSARQRTAAADGWCDAVRPLLTGVPQQDLTEREQANLKSLIADFDKGCA